MGLAERSRHKNANVSFSSFLFYLRLYKNFIFYPVWSGSVLNFALNESFGTLPYLASVSLCVLFTSENFPRN